MYRILIVEDDRGIAQAVAEQAKLWDLETCCVEDFRDVMGAFAAFDPHLVLLDISLPAFDGYHWCSRIRQVSKVPVIFISSAADSMNIVMAMNLGADDFIAKPFDQNVLMAKVLALLRRTYDFGQAVPVLEHRGALLSTGDGTLTYQGRRIPLTKNEYRILLALLQSKGRVVSREKLMERLWQTDSFVDENTLSVNVGRLRKNLEQAGLNDFITTKFGVGYLIGRRYEAFYAISASKMARTRGVHALRGSACGLLRAVPAAAAGGVVPARALRGAGSFAAHGGLSAPASASRDAVPSASRARPGAAPLPRRHLRGGLSGARPRARRAGTPRGDGDGRAHARHDRLLHVLGAPDQNAHLRHAPDAAE